MTSINPIREKVKEALELHTQAMELIESAFNLLLGLSPGEKETFLGKLANKYYGLAIRNIAIILGTQSLKNQLQETLRNLDNMDIKRE